VVTELIPNEADGIVGLTGSGCPVGVRDSIKSIAIKKIVDVILARDERFKVLSKEYKVLLSLITAGGFK
jgi:hypothetical protein